MRKVVLIGVGVASLAAVVYGQGVARSDSDMQALVAEIRSLRADLNRVASANIRAQLLFGRLQLQEQRTITLTRQLETIEDQIVKTALQRAAMEDRLREMEEGGATNVPLEARQEIEREVKRELKSSQAREQQLRQQQSSLSALVAEEQTRWTDFSSRLEELERALLSPRR
jgi:hypothetical protein